MKPLSEQALREKIVELVHESFDSGYIRGTWAHQNILGDNSREPSNPDDVAEQVLGLILSDRKVYGEQLLLDQMKIVTEHPEDGCVWGVEEVGKRAIECYEHLKRQRNQGEKLMPTVTNVRCPDCGCVLYIQPASFGWEKIVCSALNCDFTDRQEA